MARIVLNFHGIGVPGRDLEPGEAPYWISEDFFRSIIARVAQGGSRYPVEMTFDDGNASDLEIGARILGEYGLKATFFVLAGRVDRPGSLTREQIRELGSAGHAIGSHGWDHVGWVGLDDAGRERELKLARAALSEITGEPVTAAAIPFGRYDRSVLAALRREGFERIYSSDPGKSRRDDWPRPRRSIRNTHTMADLQTVLSGRPLSLKERVQPLKTFIKSRL